jgi:hypothetical protein
MPAIVMGDRSYKTTGVRFDQKFDYDYPEGLDLRPGSKLHDRIRDEVMERAYDSSRIISGRHGDWSAIDQTLTTYIPTDAKEELVQSKDSRKPISIVFPYSYTILETLLSYFVSAFFPDPIFRYEGVGPNDVIGAILLEKLISLQCMKNKVALNLHTQGRDAFSYGFGVTTPTWTTEYGSKTVDTPVGGMFGFGGKTERIRLENQLLFEGNALENIDPYLYLPDTSVPIHDPQSGEFVGWLNRTNYMHLLSEEKNSDGSLFNVKYLRQLYGRKSGIYPSDNSGRAIKSGVSTVDSMHVRTNTSMDRVKMYIRLIPKDWELSGEEYPELWYFELAQDEVVIRAAPANLDHNKFPVSVIAPDYDGYSLTPISRIETLSGMQGVLDFMFNSHVANVRKAINDMIIYDPYLLNSNDLKNPEPGKLIRLRRPAWGRGVKDVAQQLNVTDITRGNIADSTWIVQWMDRISGADSSMQGSLRQGGPERLTGQEFQGTRAGGVNRMERMARVIGLQGMQDIGTFFGIHNKQNMSSDSYIRLTGDWQEVLLAEYGKSKINRGRIKVDPKDIDINYNVVVRDGSVPGGNYADVWTQLFQILGSNPELAQRFDVVRIFTHIARNLGAKNVNDFVKKGGDVQPQVMPDEAVQQQVQAGNVVPLRG